MRSGHFPAAQLSRYGRPIMDTHLRKDTRVRRAGLAADIGRGLAALIVLALLAALERLG